MLLPLSDKEQVGRNDLAVCISKAFWKADELPELTGTEMWYVHKVYFWKGAEGRNALRFPKAVVLANT